MDRGASIVPRSRWLLRILGLAVWTVLGLCESVQSYFAYATHGRPIRWSQAVGLGLGLWYGWAALWLISLRLVHCLPLEQRNWLPRLTVHLAAGVVFALVKLVLDYPVIKYFYCPDPDRLSFAVFYRIALSSHFYSYLVIGWAMLGIGHALDSYRKGWERGLRAAQLEAQLARAQLRALQMQLHPHFLFNTLNSISALIHSDVELADRMVARLGDLLRLTLENAGVEEPSLRRELEFVEAYLDIDRVRFGPRLRVELAIDPDVLDAAVPCLLLQPLVENAIRHGIQRRAGAGHLLIRAERIGARLRLQVEDDGPGLCAAVEERVGLSNTRARLRQLYGNEHTFLLETAPSGGVCVTVELPFRPAEVELTLGDSAEGEAKSGAQVRWDYRSSFLGG